MLFLSAYLFDKITDFFLADSHMLEPFDLMSIMAEGATKEYFTYPGSLTTPGCGEAVTWLVSNKLAGVSMNQVSVVTYDGSVGKSNYAGFGQHWYNGDKT